MAVTTAPWLIGHGASCDPLWRRRSVVQRDAAGVVRGDQATTHVAVMDGEVGMVVLAMRDARERVHEGDRLVIVGEIERLARALSPRASSRAARRELRELGGGRSGAPGRQSSGGESVRRGRGTRGSWRELVVRSLRYAAMCSSSSGK